MVSIKLDPLKVYRHMELPSSKMCQPKDALNSFVPRHNWRQRKGPSGVRPVLHTVFSPPPSCSSLFRQVQKLVSQPIKLSEQYDEKFSIGMHCEEGVKLRYNWKKLEASLLRSQSVASWCVQTASSIEHHTFLKDLRMELEGLVLELMGIGNTSPRDLNHGKSFFLWFFERTIPGLKEQQLTF